MKLTVSPYLQKINQKDAETWSKTSITVSTYDTHRDMYESYMTSSFERRGDVIKNALS